MSRIIYYANVRIEDHNNGYRLYRPGDIIPENITGFADLVASGAITEAYMPDPPANRSREEIEQELIERWMGDEIDVYKFIEEMDEWQSQDDD